MGPEQNADMSNDWKNRFHFAITQIYVGKNLIRKKLRSVYTGAIILTGEDRRGSPDEPQARLLGAL